MADKLKFMLALLLLAAGLAGFYLLSEQPMILRVLSVLAGLGAGIAVAGQHVAGLELDAFVLAMAITLWITDKGLEWVIYDLLLGWKKS